MKVLTIFAHHRPSSLTGQIKDHFIKGLRAAGDDVDILDLHKVHWNPMVYDDDEPDYKSRGNQHFSEEVQREQARILQYDAIAFVFPTYWWNMPAILKGYIDRVFNYEFAYGSQNQMKSKIKKVLWLTLLGSDPSTAYAQYKFDQAMDCIYNVGIAEMCHIEHSRVVKFVDVKVPTEEQTNEFFERAYKEGLEFSKQ